MQDKRNRERLLLSCWHLNQEIKLVEKRVRRHEAAEEDQLVATAERMYLEGLKQARAILIKYGNI